MSDGQLKRSQVLRMEGGCLILLVDRAAEPGRSAADIARNIYLMGPDGAVRWQVASRFDTAGDAFTSVFWEDGVLRAHRQDGGVYEIDTRNGAAEARYLARRSGLLWGQKGPVPRDAFDTPPAVQALSA